MKGNMKCSSVSEDLQEKEENEEDAFGILPNELVALILIKRIGRDLSFGCKRRPLGSIAIGGEPGRSLG